MKPVALLRTGALLCGALLTACADPTSPKAHQFDALLAKGSGGGNGGGSPVGRIRTASAGAACDRGTSMGVTIRKGINNRAEVILNVVGPSTYPGPSAGTSLYWAYTITDDANGARLLAFGSSSQYVGTTARVTVSGAATTPGVHQFTFLAQNHEIVALTDFDSLLASPFVETCRASLTVTAD